MLRTADAVIEALRARKDALGLSNATMDELSGFAAGYWDKTTGPSRIKAPTIYTMMAFVGALGLAVQLIEDPDAKVEHRWTPRRARHVRQNARVSKAVLKRVRPILMHELARRGGLARWAGSSAARWPGNSPLSVGTKMRAGTHQHKKMGAYTRNSLTTFDSPRNGCCTGANEVAMNEAHYLKNATHRYPVIAARIPREIFERLDKWAIANRCTRSEAIAKIITRAVNGERAEPNKAA